MTRCSYCSIVLFSSEGLTLEEMQANDRVERVIDVEGGTGTRKWYAQIYRCGKHADLEKYPE